MRHTFRNLAALLGGGVLLAAAACSSGGGTGACLSTPVSYNFGQRVYCYNGWDKSECDDNDRQRVNGASWRFHSGDSCGDLGYTTGSNPYP